MWWGRVRLGCETPAMPPRTPRGALFCLWESQGFLGKRSSEPDMLGGESLFAEEKLTWREQLSGFQRARH